MSVSFRKPLTTTQATFYYAHDDNNNNDDVDNDDDHIFAEIEETPHDDTIASSITSETAYCSRCTRLSKDCNCVPCKKCDQFYIENMEHVCPKHVTYCGICNHKITSATNLCYICDLEKII